MHPLAGTTWDTLPFGQQPSVTINNDIDFQNHWQKLAGVYVPVANYIFKYSGNRSEYLLVGINAVDEGIFFNITKQNALKHMPLSASLTGLRTDPFDGTINQAYGPSVQQPTQTKFSGHTKITNTSSNTISVPKKQTAKQIIMNKITTPKQKCEKCGGTKTLLFTSFSCDSGCR